MTTLPMRASFAWRKELGTTDVFAGPDFLVSVDRASVSGVAMPGHATRLVFGLGVGAGALVWLTKPLALTMEASIDATLPLATSQFVVTQEEVLQQQWIQGLFSVGLTYVTSP